MEKYEELESGVSFAQPGSKVFRSGDCVIITSPPHGHLGWHMSISCAKRDPTWEEIRDAWYNLVPNAQKRNGAMFFPPINEYVNLHNHCFHVHEVPLNLKDCISLYAPQYLN